MSLNDDANNAEAEENRIQARERLACATLELTANLLRVVAEGGKPEQLAQQMVDAAVACLEVNQDGAPAFHAQFQVLRLNAHALKYPPWAYDELGNFRFDMKDPAMDIAEAQGCIVQAALRIAASSMLGQSTQARLAESAMEKALKNLESARGRKQRMHQVR